MLFTPREAPASFGDHGIVSLGQLRDKLITTCRRRGRNDFFMGSIRPAYPDIIFDGIFKKVDFLKHHAYIGHQLGIVNMPDISVLVARSNTRIRALRLSSGAENADKNRGAT